MAGQSTSGSAHRTSSCKYSTQLRQTVTVVFTSCGDIELVKKYFTKESFTNRPTYAALNAFTNPGIIMYNGETWRALKRFTMKALKSLGFGRSVFEPEMHREINYFLDYIDHLRKKGPIKIGKLTGPAASNVVTLIVVGERFDYDHPTRKKLDEIFLRAEDGEQKRIDYLSPINFVESFRDLLLKFPLPLPLTNRLKELQRFNKKYIRSRVEAVKLTFDWQKDEPKNYIEYFIKEVNENRDDPDFDMKYFDEEYLIQNCYAFFVAGSATTQEYLEWWFLVMSQYPEVQERMRKEVDEMIGDKKATLSDRNSMPYTEAVIHEVHRWASLIGVNLPHCVFEESEFGPYLLPAGTQIIVNMDKIHHDPDNFAKPDEFLPERFLSADGKKFTRSEKVIPFGYGKRSCPGESLAQAEIFLFAVSTLQRFIIKPTKKFDGKTYTSVFSRIPNSPVEIIAEPRA